MNAIHTLLNNGYPFSFVFSKIDERFHIHNNNTHDTHLQKEKYFTIPYVKSISESFYL